MSQFPPRPNPLLNQEEPKNPQHQKEEEGTKEGLRHLLRLQEQAYRRMGNKQCNAEADEDNCQEMAEEASD